MTSLLALDIVGLLIHSKVSSESKVWWKQVIKFLQYKSFCDDIAFLHHVSGWSVSLSSDGFILAVGVYTEDAALLFQNDGSGN